MKPVMTMILTAAILATTATALVPTDAAAMRRGDNAVPEQRLKLKAEWAQARRAGGYNDPISGLIGLLTGDAPDSAIQPVINDPKPESIFDNFDNTSKWRRSTD